MSVMTKQRSVCVLKFVKQGKKIANKLRNLKKKFDFRCEIS